MQKRREAALQCDETEKWKYDQERQSGLQSTRVKIDDFVFKLAGAYNGTEQFIKQIEKYRVDTRESI